MICTHCKAEWKPPVGVSVTQCPFCGKPLFEIQNSEQNAEPHEILLGIVRQYDRNILGDIRLKGMLSDLMPHVKKKYMRIFRQALDDKIGAKLLEMDDEDNSIRIVKINTLKDSFKNNNGFNDTADYVVDCFLYALGWIETVVKDRYDKGEDGLSFLRQQIEIAFINGSLNKEEAKALFTLGQKSGFPENEIADLINAKIKNLKLEPYPNTPESLKNQKEIICSSDWVSDKEYPPKTIADINTAESQKNTKNDAVDAASASPVGQPPNNLSQSHHRRKKNTIITAFLLIILTSGIIAGSMMIRSHVQNNQSPYGGFKKTDSGIYYKFHVRSGDTKKPQLNDLMTLVMRYGTEDSNLFDSRLNPHPMVFPLSLSQYKGDIYEALSMMSKGDSATFILPADSFFLVTAGARFIPDFINSDADLFFDVKMENIQSNAEYQQAEQFKNDQKSKMESDKIQEYIQRNNIQVAPTASGLYFLETTPGNGKKPVEGDWVKVNFALSLLDKVPIYSSFEGEPTSFEYGKQLENQGVTEAISMMSEGGRASLIVPSSLAFGAAGRGDIVPPYSTLLYDIQIVKIQTKEEHQADLEIAIQIRQANEEKNRIESQRFLEQNSKKEGVITLPSGLQYKVIRMGTGEKPGPTDMVTVHYTGTLIDGTVFDSSIERGQPATFRVNGVIQGWTEALQLMPVGSKWTLYIPSDLAYKNQQRGSYIEPNMALIFDVELLSVSND